MLLQKGLKFDPDSLSYRTLCHKMLKRQFRLYKVRLAREQGDYDYEMTLVSPSGKPQVEQPTETLKEVIKEYVSEAEANWTPKTKAEIVDDSLSLLVEVMGNIPLQSIDRRKMNELKSVLRKLPPNRNKLKKYRDKSIAQLVKMDVDKTLSERTINKHLSRIGTLFDYAITNGYFDGPNPALKMSLPLNQTDEESRAAYTLEELTKLFRSERYLTDTHLQPYQFWTPILALFTAMRQNEIAQLYLDDIRQEDGVWYFDLNKDQPNKKLKNKNAKRQVPIHRFLLDDLINLRGNYGAHTLRKTFGYHQRVTFGAGIPELMEMFNHSNQRQTLAYLCVQPEEVKNLYMNEI